MLQTFSVKKRLKTYVKQFLPVIIIMLSFNASATVLVSLKPIAFIATAITDGITDTDFLLPDGASPHTYALRPSDIQRLRSAELFIWVGPDLEAFIAKTLRTVKPQKQLLLSDVDNIKALIAKNHVHDDKVEDDHEHADHEHEHVGHDHGQYDMHLWLSPAIAKQIAIAVHAKLLEQMPQNAVKLNINLQTFLQNLQESEQFIEKYLKSVQNKGYFVFHDAYGYFEERFGLKHLGSFTINPELQPGAQKLYQIRTDLVNDQAVCVFSEPQFRPAVIQSLTKGTNVRIGTLDPLGIDVNLAKDSYNKFLINLSKQFYSCLSNKS